MIDKQTLDEWLQEYLSNDEDFLMSNTAEQAETFKVYRTILSAVGKTIQYDNVFPLLVASNVTTTSVLALVPKVIALLNNFDIGPPSPLVVPSCVWPLLLVKTSASWSYSLFNKDANIVSPSVNVLCLV